ncbi:MAG: acyl carrier protein [Myxococcota bacterium]
MHEIRETLRQFITESFLFGQEDPAMTDEAPLVEMGILNSTGVLELVAFIEERFGTVVDDAELVHENFGSIAAMADFIARKTSEVCHG